MSQYTYYQTIVALEPSLSCYQVHQQIAGLFNRSVDIVELGSRPYLYRKLNRTGLVDGQGAQEYAFFVIHSEDKPKEHSSALFKLAPKLMTITCEVGDELLFKTDVSLVWRMGNKEMYAFAKKWLEKKAPQIGVEFLNYQNEDSYIEIKPKCTVKKSTIEGRLRVTDPDKLVLGMRNGISRQKAFGFGLLSLIPVK